MSAKNQIVSIDLGMGNMKAWTEHGGIALPSQVAAPVRADLDLSALGIKTGKKPMTILNGAGPLFVGAGAYEAGRPIERLDYDKLAGSPEMRALVYAALTAARIDPARPIDLFVGLPMGIAQSKTLIDDVKNWLSGVHVWKANKREHTAVVASVGCMSQAYGAYIDWMMNVDGTVKNMPGKADEIGVISIGYNTIEMIVFLNHQASRRFTVGTKQGVRRFLEMANSARGGSYALGELDNLLRDGVLDEPAALEKWNAQVKGTIESEWGDQAQRFAKVLAVGGGALLLDQALTEIFGSRLERSDEPILSVARGLYVAGVAKAAKAAKA